MEFTESSIQFGIYQEWIALMNTFRDARILTEIFAKHPDMFSSSGWFYQTDDFNSPNQEEHERVLLDAIRKLYSEMGTLHHYMIYRLCSDELVQWWRMHESSDYNKTPSLIIIYGTNWVVLDRVAIAQELS